MKITEFKLGKGVTRKVLGTENDFNRKYFEVTVKLPQDYEEQDLHQAVTRAEYFLDDIIGAPEVGAIPRFDVASLDALPWKKRNKQPAEPGEFAWLFGPGSRDGTEQGAEWLVKVIQATKDGNLVIGNMEYSLVKEGAFLQRKPLK
jgi:hypothetical protein